MVYYGVITKSIKIDFPGFPVELTCVCQSLSSARLAEGTTGLEFFKCKFSKQVDITIKHPASPQLLEKQVLSQFLTQISIFYKKLYSWENFQNYMKSVMYVS